MPTMSDEAARGRTQLTVFVSALMFIALVGAVVRAAFLVDHPMRYDESCNYMRFSAYSPAFVVTNYFPNNHVLHTLLVKVSIHLFGNGPAALRLPAFIGGVLLIPATAWLAWTLSASRFVAILAALATCVSSPLIEYSANARGYSWLTVFTTLLIICTLRLLNTPAKRWMWVCWGLLGALGAYTIPLMLFPVTGSSLVLLAGALGAPKDTQRRSALVRGSIVGLAVCAALTFVLYLPIIVAEGVDGLRETNRMTYAALGRQVESFGGMLTSIVELFVRDSHVVWPWLVVFGLVAYAVSVVRRPTVAALAPLSVLLCGLVIAALTRAPLPARAWLFALPVVLACALQGICDLRHLLGLGRFTRRAPAMAAGAVLLAATAAPLVTVCGRPYLCSERDGLVEVEAVIDECDRLGPARCAIVSRYNPAVAYYLLRKEMERPGLPSSPTTEQVFIITDPVRSLADLWHEGVDGFDAFSAPRAWRKLAQGPVYVAQRRGSGEGRSKPNVRRSEADFPDASEHSATRGEPTT